MMPVIRVSVETYARLKKYAQPFEDTPESVITKALTALEMIDGAASPAPLASTAQRTDAPKLPQKEFRYPLLMTLLKFGGKAQAKDVRSVLGPIMTPKLSEGDYESVSTGDPRWWNATCWERSDLVKDGLMRDDSERGVWEISEAGKNLEASLVDGMLDQNARRTDLATGSLHDMATMYWRHDMGIAALRVGDALFDPILFRSVDELELSVRAGHCMKNAAIVYLGDLVQLSELDLLRMANMGSKACAEIKGELARHGLKLAMQLPGGPVKFADIV